MMQWHHCDSQLHWDLHEDLDLMQLRCSPSCRDSRIINDTELIRLVTEH